MPIRIISSDERLSINIDGSIFYYRRIKSHEAYQMRQRHTQRGAFNDNTFGNELLERYVLGWDNVLDGKNKKIDFKTEYLADLESPVKVQLIRAINGDVHPEDDFDTIGDQVEKK